MVIKMEDNLSVQQLFELFKETRELFKETREQIKETSEQIKDAREQTKESERIFYEQLRESDRMLTEKFRETDERIKKTETLIANLGKELGGLGRSIGNIAEGLSYPSLAKELEEKFKVDVVAPNFEVRKGGEVLEFDVFAYSNSNRNEAFIVEVKTNLSEAALEQLENSVNKFHKFLPDFANKKVYGIVCALKASKKLIHEVHKRGFYFATVKDGFFKLIKQPEDLPVKSF